MSDTEKSPIAVQQPNILLPLRPVCLDDTLALHTNLWQYRPLVDIQDFVARVTKFANQKRGIGIVVVDKMSSTQPIIAYGQVTQWLQCAEISDLMVHPDYQSRGIGTAMIQYLTHYAIEQKVSSVELGVAKSNPRALQLYRRLGFRKSYTLELDLGQGREPVIYLSLDLTPYF